MLQFAEVALNIPFESDTLTYEIPHEFTKIDVGMRVQVPLRNRKVEGVIVEIHRQYPSHHTKTILKQIDKSPVINQEQIDLAWWVKEYYLSSLGEAIFKMLPSGKRKRNLQDFAVSADSELLQLNEEQQSAYEGILGTFHQEATHLLYGITGSGKTEVYIHLIYQLLENTDKSAIFLVPEISLTVQTLKRLELIFGNQLAIQHSALRKSDKYNSYLQILSGEKRIVVGTRSAIFAPVPKLGLVIIDEEHDSSYKEHSSPRYHARQIAMQRCKKNGAPLVLGSATPSVELFFHAMHNNVFCHRLTQRAKKAKLSEIRIYDKKENGEILGSELLFQIKKRLEKKEQSILLLNRRGYSPLIYARNAKKFIECPNCTANLCYHKKGHATCHLCGYTTNLKTLEKEVGEELDKFGAGTQKLEEFLLEKFPTARIERLDQDAARNKEVLAEVIGRLVAGEIDILTGTQMISKGLDAAKVTLVGVVNANIGLGLPDFRAGERVYSLLTQVAGRAGRSERPGEVIIETNNSYHPVIQLATTQNYENFYKTEIHARYHTFYPPYSRLIRLLARSKSEEKSQQAIDTVHTALVQAIDEAKEQDDNPEQKIIVLGPAACTFYRIDSNFRNHIIIKTNVHLKVKQILRQMLDGLKLPHKVYLEIDIDPVDLV
ncbi:MAG: primosomal protein N' [Spirochaetota bacterium]